MKSSANKKQTMIKRTQTIDKPLYKKYLFFKQHAGYCTPPGKAVCAIALARAEMWIEANDMEENFLWEHDEGGEDCLGDHEYWCPIARRIEAGYTSDGEALTWRRRYKKEHCEHEVLWCALIETTNNGTKARYQSQYDVLASCGGIIDPSREYRRVIQAELASEVLHDHTQTTIAAYAGSNNNG